MKFAQRLQPTFQAENPKIAMGAAVIPEPDDPLQIRCHDRWSLPNRVYGHCGDSAGREPRNELCSRLKQFAVLGNIWDDVASAGNLRPRKIAFDPFGHCRAWYNYSGQNRRDCPQSGD
ncbi:hypothetical protein [Sphingorhabdus sp. EL138]|uniref:hypothetical protein n=1 Tax=Sphingorhabdus sp. EL138 TaxID=2073156 RepID=UPI00345DE520